jgi:SAM-dependent methyltransferase
MTRFETKCKQSRCRCCQNLGLKPVLDLGLMPLTGKFLTKSQLSQQEDKYPLQVVYCPGCGLMQILETVLPEKIFCEDYPYYSSFSDTLLEHSRTNVLSLIDRRKLTDSSFVVELASNDGYLLKTYVQRGIPCLGIDPAQGPTQVAKENGVPTICEFFTEDMAKQLTNDGRKADVIHANNVLAHVANTNEFVKGIRILLKNDGVAVIEVPYVRDLIQKCEFDTIYHEHLCYFSVTVLDYLFRRNGLFLNEVQHLPIHGGSLRLFVEPTKNVHDSVRALLTKEAELGVVQYEYYKNFKHQIQKIRDDLRELIFKLKADNKHLAAYGAAAKGVVLLNYIGVSHEVIDFVVDRNTHKQGKYMPGVHIPIFDPAKLIKDMPDYVVILPWNFTDEILHQQADFRTKGGKFIIPIPEPVVV